MTATKLAEVDIKALVLGRLRRLGLIDSSTPVASEFRLGNRPSRADLAAFGRSFIGVEVKSESDSLRRLPAQMAAYNQHFERIVLAVAERHVSNLDLTMLQGAELWIVQKNGQIHTAEHGVGAKTFAPDFTSLMTKAESRRFLPRPGEPQPPLSQRDAFSAAFRARYEETSAAFWREVKGRSITADHLEMLSRFRSVRERQSQFVVERNGRRLEWCAEALRHIRAA